MKLNRRVSAGKVVRQRCPALYFSRLKHQFVELRDVRAASLEANPRFFDVEVSILLFISI